MKRSFLIGAAIFAGAVVSGFACGGASSDLSECPEGDPACVAADGATVGDTSAAADGPGTMLPPGSTVLPDGAVLLPDGRVIDPTAPVAPCTPGATQCTNCKDDDGDGLLDWMDPECTGALDNDEGSFKTGIPGDNVDSCMQDCFFDGNSGSGDDGCVWDLRCKTETATKACPYDPKLAPTPGCKPLSTKCKDYCKPLTPKGCDCFGCCDVYAPDGKLYTVRIGSTCTYKDIADPTKCPACTKNLDCDNPCGKCDLCLGKTSVPPECYPPPPDGGTTDGGTSPPPTTSCPSGYTACDATHPCATGFYCLTGCCVKAPS